ncbi:3-deoxy-manno-octulosonate cytidylyltransferase [Dankookia rubra]|uniref:3-deoxy-manno-octulosonate cytidylyltransferase n=1 Tax=Dankookia rubra TaxID=1442381 RepID=A0A4R5QF61_9PROT|nr:3-deoxy-manno-octulosonate cytidylyltransferase [Dankookia rubra]TDH61329.1 3-deoxy-manno-octulosonate cytidylyltransferase [Dankookia rubra]
MNPLVLIPARMASTRLPDKPLLDIHGLPMIVHVLKRAQEADVGAVAVATDAQAIADAIRDHGGTAVMTGEHHLSGSDRIHEALGRLDPDGRHDILVNVQGDLPTISAGAIRASLAPMAEPEVALATLIAEIHDLPDRTASQVVKFIGTALGGGRHRALYFTRATAPWGEGPLWHHIGLYAWRRTALARFVALPPSPLELREKLEQLRALEAGMRIDAMEVDEVPLGVDTPADLEKARRMLAPQGEARA